MKEINKDRRNFFTISKDGEDELSLLIPHKHLKTLHYTLNILLGRDGDVKNPKIMGHYVTIRGTLK